MSLSLHPRYVAWTLLLAIAGSIAFIPGATAQKVGMPGAPFALTDHNGKAFSSAGLTGRPYAIFFGFTSCPDVCPTTLTEVSNHLAALGPDGDRLTVIFVTVDPERDTAEHLRAYLGSFDPRIVGLTGSEVEIAAVTKIWNAYYQKVPESDGTYTIVHSAHVYLMDAGNRLAGTLNFQEAEADQLRKLKALVAGRAIE